jgi:hypothetical protein
MRQMQRAVDRDLFKEEIAYRNQIRVDDNAGDAELFN